MAWFLAELSDPAPEGMGLHRVKAPVGSSISSTSGLPHSALGQAQRAAITCSGCQTLILYLHQVSLAEYPEYGHHGPGGNLLDFAAEAQVLLRRHLRVQRDRFRQIAHMTLCFLRIFLTRSLPNTLTVPSRGQIA